MRRLRRRPPGRTHRDTDSDGSPAAGGRNLVLLSAGQFVNSAGLMMLVPIMPFYVERLNSGGSAAATQVWTGVAIAAPPLALTVVTPLWGRVGDRLGRKWMVVRALVGLSLAMLVMAGASGPVILVLGRLLQGMLGGVVEAAAAFAGSAGLEAKRGSALGKSFAATAAGSLVGPVAGGLLVRSGHLPSLMMVIAAAAVVLAMCCAAWLREPICPAALAATSASPQGRRRPPVMRVPHAVILAIAAACAYFGSYGLIPVFAEHVRHLAPGTANMWVGVLHSIMWGGTLIGSVWWGARNDTTGRPLRTFAIAAGGCAASIAGLALPLAPAAMIPLRLFQGFCFAALAQSLFMYFGRHAPEQHRSSFVGVANSFLLAGQSAGPLLAGPLVVLLPAPAAIAVMAAMCAAACLLTIGPARSRPADSGSAGPRQPGLSRPRSSLPG